MSDKDNVDRNKSTDIYMEGPYEEQDPLGKPNKGCDKK